MDSDADFAEIFEEDTTSQSIQMLNGLVEEINQNNRSGIGVRIYKDCQTVYGYTNDLEMESLLAFVSSLKEAFGNIEKQIPIQLKEEIIENKHPVLIHPIEADLKDKIDLLKKAGCEIVVFDPVAMDECKRRIGDSVIYADDMYSALQRADALLLLTEWKQFRIPDWSRVKNEMANSLIVDGRNIYEIKDMMQWGFDYLSIGRTDKFYASSAKKI